MIGDPQKRLGEGGESCDEEVEEVDVSSDRFVDSDQRVQRDWDLKGARELRLGGLCALHSCWGSELRYEQSQVEA
jgi:hypothetical protein